MYRIKSIISVIICLSLLAVGFVGVRWVNKQYIYPIKYEEEVLRYSVKYQLDAYLVLSVIKVESSFNENAVSNKGANGLMQMLPSTAKYVAKSLNRTEYNLLDSEDSIEFGCYYLRYLINKFESVNLALAAYNAGEGRVREWLVSFEGEVNDSDLSYIQFKETKQYLKKIKKSLSKYKKLYGNLLDK